MTDKMVTFRATKEFYRHLVMSAHKVSLEKNENLSVSDIIRDALEKAYPFDASSLITGVAENGRENSRGRSKK